MERKIIILLIVIIVILSGLFIWYVVDDKKQDLELANNNLVVNDIENNKSNDNELVSQINIETGDYVNYPIDLTKTVNINSEESGYQSQQLKANDVKWRVFKNENGNITLISEDITNEIGFGDFAGAENSIEILDNTMDKLYSNEFGKARNMKIEDVNDILQGVEYSGYEELFDSELLYCYVYDNEKLDVFKTIENEKAYNLIFLENEYWLSSYPYFAGGDVDSDDGIRFIVGEEQIYLNAFYTSHSWDNSYKYGTRAIVTLNEGIKLEVDNEKYNDITVWDIEQ